MAGNPIKGNETPSIEQIIKAAIEGRLVDFHTMLPGEFIKYDPTKQKADVKILIKRKYADGSVVELPVLVSVPVKHPRTDDCFIHIPIKPGDNCMVLFAERSLDIWKKFGGSTDPQDARKFHLSDGVAIPGLYSFSEAFTVTDPTALTLKNKDGVIEVIPAGKFKFYKQGGDEVLDILVQIVDRLIETENQLVLATTNTIFGPLQLNNFAQFNTLKTQITALKDRLDALRGA